MFAQVLCQGISLLYFFALWFFQNFDIVMQHHNIIPKDGYKCVTQVMIEFYSQLNRITKITTLLFIWLTAFLVSRIVFFHLQDISSSARLTVSVFSWLLWFICLSLRSENTLIMAGSRFFGFANVLSLYFHSVIHSSIILKGLLCTENCDTKMKTVQFI